MKRALFLFFCLITLHLFSVAYAEIAPLTSAVVPVEKPKITAAKPSQEPVTLAALKTPPEAAAPRIKELELVTGSVTGTYYQLGKDIASLFSPHTLEVQVEESKGSIENIYDISKKDGPILGIVQSDVLGFLMRSNEPSSQRLAEQIRMVFPLHQEEVHVIAKRSIKSFSDLDHKNVVVGAQGSGSWLTAMNLFSLTGVRPSKMLRLSPDEGLVAVLRNKADAMIYVSGKPVKLFYNLSDLVKHPDYAGLVQEMHFIPLSDSRITAEYSAASITSKDYPFVTDSVPTVAVTAVLVSYDMRFRNPEKLEATCHMLSEFGDAMNQHIKKLKQNGHEKWKEVDLNAEVGNWKREPCTISQNATFTLENELLNTMEMSW